jgi:hypothetical protein
MSTAEEPKNRLQKAQVDTSHRRAMDWLESHAPQSARIAIPRPAAASLMANPDRKSVSREEQQEMQSELARYDYLVEEEASPIDALRKRRGALVNGNGLKLVYEDVPGRIRIWQVRPAL